MGPGVFHRLLRRECAFAHSRPLMSASHPRAHRALPRRPARRPHAGALTAARRSLWIGIALAVLFVGLAPLVSARLTANANEPAKAPGVGDLAPDVQLEDQHGKAFALGDALRAREFVVIAFYPKAFTGG